MVDCYTLTVTPYTLSTDQLFHLEFEFESVFNLEFQPKFGISDDALGIQLGIPIPMGINLGECMTGGLRLEGRLI